MNKVFFLFFVSIFNLTHGMDIQNQQTTLENLMSRAPQKLTLNIFDKQINEAVQVCKPYSFDQKKLIRYVLTVSRVNKHYHEYINSLEYIKNLFKQLPDDVKFPFACCLIKKSLNGNCGYGIDDINKWVKQFGPATKQTAVQKYCSPTINLCTNILSLNIEQIQQLLNKGADPDFYIDLGNVECSIPPVLVTLANNSSDDNQKKLSLLLSYGADVNINPSIDFMLPYDGISNSCLCANNPTPLAIAIAYDNQNAVTEILKYKPQNLSFNQVFLSTNTVIKQIMLAQPFITQKDLDLGLKTALVTENEDDVKLLLEKGANPQDSLHKAVDRTINYCLNPASYKNYNSLSANPGTNNFRGYDYETSNPSIPNTHLVEQLCNHGAYDADMVKKLKKLQETTSAMIAMLENNKPH